MARSLFDLAGKVTLVTGGNGGIGLGFARGIAKQGGALAIWGRNPEKSAAAKAELEELGASKVTTQIVDVDTRRAVVEGYAQLLADHGRIDCVFANSGRSSKSRSVLTIDEQEWHDLLATSLHGAFWTLQEGAKRMVARAEAGEPGGSLVFCGSLAMFQGNVGIPNYSAAKGGMGAVVRGMAVELGKFGIRVNSIAPGLIKSQMMAGMPDDHPLFQHYSSKTPIPRVGRTEDFEGIAAYLASDASSFHSGDTLVIDGALLINSAAVM